ncbi:MAG: hypothetical protein GX587_02845 [Bacteroidales bacterium]|nr:hypothetical protein [Bacteroidales bacterium]
MKKYFDIPDEGLRTEEELRKRIADKQKIMASLSALNDGLEWLDLNDSVKLLKKRLQDMEPKMPESTVKRESVEERLKREAKERWEKRCEDAGDNWWEKFD